MYQWRVSHQLLLLSCHVFILEWVTKEKNWNVKCFINRCSFLLWVKMQNDNGFEVWRKHLAPVRSPPPPPWHCESKCPNQRGGWFGRMGLVGWGYKVNPPELDGKRLREGYRMGELVGWGGGGWETVSSSTGCSIMFPPHPVHVHTALKRGQMLWQVQALSPQWVWNKRQTLGHESAKLQNSFQSHKAYFAWYF